MNIMTITNKATILLFSILLSACQSNKLHSNQAVSTAENTNIKVVNKAALLNDKNIELPSNYDVSAFGLVNIAAYVNNIRFKDGSTKSSIDQSIIGKIFENELSRTKRFNVLTRLCSSCDSELAYQQLNTGETAAMTRGEELNPDLIVETDIDFGMAMKRLYDHNAVVFYSIATTKIINPTTKETINAFAPIRTNLVEKVFTEMSPGSGVMTGFNYHDANEVEQAYKDAAQKTISVLASKIIDYYPVGGRVTNFRSGRLAIDSGIMHGFAMKQPVVIFLSDDGIDIPLASAEITPKQSSGSGLILKWRDDKESQNVQQKIEALGKDYLRQNKIYAVSVGTPQEWVN